MGQQGSGSVKDVQKWGKKRPGRQSSAKPGLICWSENWERKCARGELAGNEVQPPCSPMRLEDLELHHGHLKVKVTRVLGPKLAGAGSKIKKHSAQEPEAHGFSDGGAVSA